MPWSGPGFLCHPCLLPHAELGTCTTLICQGWAPDHPHISVSGPAYQNWVLGPCTSPICQYRIPYHAHLAPHTDIRLYTPGLGPGAPHYPHMPELGSRALCYPCLAPCAGIGPTQPCMLGLGDQPCAIATCCYLDPAPPQSSPTCWDWGMRALCHLCEPWSGPGASCHPCVLGLGPRAVYARIGPMLSSVCRAIRSGLQGSPWVQKYGSRVAAPPLPLHQIFRPMARPMGQKTWCQGLGLAHGPRAWAPVD